MAVNQKVFCCKTMSQDSVSVTTLTYVSPCLTLSDPHSKRFDLKSRRTTRSVAARTRAMRVSNFFEGPVDGRCASRISSKFSPAPENA